MGVYDFDDNYDGGGADEDDKDKDDEDKDGDDGGGDDFDDADRVALRQYYRKLLALSRGQRFLIFASNR